MMEPYLLVTGFIRSRLGLESGLVFFSDLIVAQSGLIRLASDLIVAHSGRDSVWSALRLAPGVE
jgi:hypothetical protein